MQDIQEAAPAISAFLQDRTLLTMLRLFLPSLPLHSQLIKLQCNTGVPLPPAACGMLLSCLHETFVVHVCAADMLAPDGIRWRRVLSHAL